MDDINIQIREPQAPRHRLELRAVGIVQSLREGYAYIILTIYHFRYFKNLKIKSPS